ncbi:bifunctional phosphoribosyl-AMP cyclohydrolase/phosphoribosyl-ATP diphosphatase HisIE [Desulfuromonas acetoxidans]|uniref:Histidine biosynthesis bifunctional protein HisIE n=1 Tax=Desulfuromonas acetoxidans (strain DSM 684 / 11070) TaxID=281689 RepID=Q1K280_DESA6|nr:bifunctional phosphoribosyl-AMP cyclohydrolase/phosphoribosyl-ATP diphosphatase HisIE [Desulfuromonas acetoxidans]EAT16559.1 phosphoribosyl-AMP cyclohydrolase [Desulfuromonas acetoxidans DSM 684]MBF0644476.1 bifunctional phosphoribosyl-AMP cyclohydrolase/phosphoribosyl-ATP diphosphatase HisIE [Desulfuromonas acetoxidans]NVD24670.1 bifunctional phosphoribosyl-AMP cyclohydrolase/phosphoribosyl-ATP diphosphatase HisIE [Desulfuromonas acetoxidans]NVE16715.1 bifunctional phosphoribosyl-AMP cycloh
MRLVEQLKFDDNGLVPCITQDVDSGEVLMLAYMNEEAVENTLNTGKVHYYSRSRGKQWMKGESSGHVQKVREIRYDCDGDTVLIKVEQVGAACHTGRRSCFYSVWDDSKLVIDGEPEVNAAQVYGEKDILDAVYHVIQDRRRNPSEKSYVHSLFTKGLDKILSKIGEEATETAVAGKGGDREEVIYEVADLFFHTLILLGYYDLPPERIYAELRRRFGLSGIEEKESRSK